MRIVLVVLGVMALVACRARDFDPPDEPVHDVSEDGFLHARGQDLPFLCVDPATGDAGPCPIGRPEPVNLSCDAAGCHGDNDYTEPPDAERALHGSDGPSCWTCHDQEWSRRTQ